MQKKKEVRDLYWTEKIKNFGYNIKYKAVGFFQASKKQGLLAPNQTTYILGQKFHATQQNAKQVNQAIFKLFSSTIWLTYRSNFPQLFDETAGDFISDTGWGCMVRVGQMLFAQLLKKHRNLTQKQQISQLVNLFNDFDPKAAFSIQNIAQLARKQYNLKPGQWYNPSQISFILETLYRKKKLSGYENLSIKIYNSGNLFFDQLVQEMAHQKKKCSCELSEDKVVCQLCYETRKAMAVVVLIRIGLDQPQEKYLEVLNKMIQIPYFQGIIGGKPQKALYFVGKNNNRYIYLDPHYVQTASQTVNQIADSYFCGSFRKCKNKCIDPSLGISFYVRDISQLNKLYEMLMKIKKENLEDFFIFLANKTPEYAKQKYLKPNHMEMDEDEYFQAL